MNIFRKATISKRNTSGPILDKALTQRFNLCGTSKNKKVSNTKNFKGKSFRNIDEISDLSSEEELVSCESDSQNSNVKIPLLNKNKAEFPTEMLNFDIKARKQMTFVKQKNEETKKAS